MNESIFLMDSNAFIEPFNTYYKFSFAKKFWDQLEENIKDGSIAILDLVKAEILKGDDELSDWMKDIEIGHYIDRRQPEMLQIYRQVLDGVQINKCYKAVALNEWSKETKADPWLIAAAAVEDLIIVTPEKSNSNLNSGSPSKEPKIPDEAKRFNVQCCDLFSMMEELDIIL